MAWTAPITWVVGQVVTAATMNAQVSGNLAAVASGWDRCQVTNSATQTVGTSATLLTWNVNNVITNAAMHSTSTNPSRLIAATAGTYRYGIYLPWIPPASSTFQMRKNAAGSSTGGTLLMNWALGSFGGFAGLDNIALAANDYVEFFATSYGTSSTLYSSTTGLYADVRLVNL